MDVYQLLKKLNGEIVSNKAIVIIDGEPVEVGGIVDNEFKLNEKGLELAELMKILNLKKEYELVIKMEL